MNKIAVLLIVFVTMVPSAWGQVTCSSDISYSWKRSDGAQVDVKWGSFQAKEADEATAKIKLRMLIDQEMVRAREVCQKEHENLSGCFSAKYTASYAILQSLNFSARKSMEEAISSDCKKQQGQCEQSKVTDPACVAAAGAAGGAASSEGAGGKEEKSKKKK